MITILFVHQSAELYGSDKTLLLLVKQLDKTKFYPVVVLPNEGILKDELEKENIQVFIAPVLKVSRNMYTFWNIVSLPFQIFQSFSVINKQLKGKKIDIVHSNTLAVLTGAFYAKKYKIRHIWHVHEIISHPRLISNLYPKVVNYFSNTAVFNSFSTQDFMVNKYPRLIIKSKVVLNGFDRLTPVSSPEEIINYRRKYFNASETDIIIALVGRISRWKGQQLLLNAFSKIENVNLNVKLAFVGSAPPNQEFFLESLQEKIKEYRLEEKVVILPFQNDIWKIWDSIDIAVVPSTEPEPFGLVAIEAMLASKPVIAADHGGLKEIVIDNETGFLIEPNNEILLANAIQKLVDNPKLRNSFGEKGCQRALNTFSLESHVNHFEKIFYEMLNK